MCVSTALPLLFLPLTVPTGGPPSPERTPDDTVRYAVVIRPGADPAFDVTMRFDVPAGDVDLFFPAFTPGGFTSNWARSVRRLRIVDGSGHPLAFRRTGTHTWRLHAPGPGDVAVRYEVVPDTEDALGLIANALSAERAFFQGTTVFMSGPALRDRPVTLTVEAPAGWRSAAPLARVGPTTWTGPTYDALALAPVEAGPFRERLVDVDGCGCAVRLVVDDPAMPTYDTAAVDRIIRRLVQGTRAVYGSAPFDTLLLLLHWRPDLDFGGGVARRSAVVMNIGAGWMPDLAPNLAGTFAHELGHTWNSGVFHPAGFARPDYTAEQPGEFLWLIEGWTTYVLLEVFGRLGWLSADRFLELMSADLTTLETATGRGHLSLAESGAADWIRAVESLPATQGGVVVAFVLDLTIRRSSGGTRSLDDVLRTLHEAARRDTYTGYDRAQIVRALAATAGRDLTDLYAQLVEGRDRVDYTQWLDGTGVSVRAETADDGSRSYRFEATAEGMELVRAIVTPDSTPRGR